MNLLIATSFRPFGISKNNDLYQLMFLNSLKNLNCDLTICATQFDDPGVENVLSESGLNYIYNNKLDDFIVYLGVINFEEKIFRPLKIFRNQKSIFCEYPGSNRRPLRYQHNALPSVIE